MAVTRRLLSVGAAAAVLAVLLSLVLPLARPARASILWCWWDPNFIIDGRRVDVYGLVPVNYLDRVPKGESIQVTALVNPRTSIQDVTQDYQLYDPDGNPTGVFSTVEIVRDPRIPRGMALFVIEVEGEGVPVRGEVWIDGTLTLVRYGTSDNPLVLWAVVNPGLLFAQGLDDLDELEDLGMEREPLLNALLRD